jgi:hypothetical protein
MHRHKYPYLGLPQALCVQLTRALLLLINVDE